VIAGAVAQEASGNHQFGPLNIDYIIAEEQAQATVTLTLEGIFADKAVLSYKMPVYNFKIAAGGARAEGNIELMIAQATELSAIEGHFTTWNSAAKSTRFDGKLTSWVAPDSLILFEQDFWLTGSLNARTTVRNNAKSGVQVDILSGTIVMFSTLLLPPSPIAVTPIELIVGNDKVTQGAKMTLTPPRPLQPERCFCNASFRRIPLR